MSEGPLGIPRWIVRSFERSLEGMAMSEQETRKGIVVTGENNRIANGRGQEVALRPGIYSPEEFDAELRRVFAELQQTYPTLVWKSPEASIVRDLGFTSEPKPERITEAEIVEWDKNIADWLPHLKGVEAAEAVTAQRLVREVRRLRGLIESEYEQVVASRVAPITRAFQTEAEAIRAERGRAGAHPDQIITDDPHPWAPPERKP